MFISVVLLSLVGVLKKGSIALTSADKGVLFGYGHANTFAGSAGILIFLMFAICRNNLKNTFCNCSYSRFVDFLFFESENKFVIDDCISVYFITV